MNTTQNKTIQAVTAYAIEQAAKDQGGNCPPRSRIMGSKYINGDHILVDDGKGGEKKVLAANKIDWLGEKFPEWKVDTSALKEMVQEFDEPVRVRLERRCSELVSERDELVASMNELETTIQKERSEQTAEINQIVADAQKDVASVQLEMEAIQLERSELVSEHEKTVSELSDIVASKNEVVARYEKQAAEQLEVVASLQGQVDAANEQWRTLQAKRNRNFTSYLRSHEFFLAMVVLFQLAQIPITSYAVGAALPETWHYGIVWAIAGFFGIGLELSTLVLIVNGRVRMALVSAFVTLIVSGYTFGWLHNILSLMVERVDFWANTAMYSTVSVLIVALIFAFSDLAKEK